ncbi:MAG: hypothetical protein ACRDRO_25480 [Pseudonocardiaceae bacterium]
MTGLAALMADPAQDALAADEMVPNLFWAYQLSRIERARAYSGRNSLAVNFSGGGAGEF